MKTYRKDIPVYEYIAFITGFALLSFELVASRLLAPAIGSSIYVWTSIIGVIIAALAMGYNYGGHLADRRTKLMDIVWLLSGASIGITFTMLLAAPILDILSQVSGDPRVLGTIASLILFSPVSFLLGAVSPYLARMKNASVKTTGTTVASLSASNSIGGIAGTFMTGFLFFSYLGTRETLLLTALLLLAASWLLRPRELARQRVLLSLLVASICIISFAIKPSSIFAITDTPTATYKISDVSYKGRMIRAITAGPGGLQSGTYNDGSKELALDYTRKLAETVDAASRKDRILILGGGGFVLPQYLAEKYPSSLIDVVEIDPELVSIARLHFGFKDPPNVRILAQDARTFLNRNSQPYDVVLVDAYNDDLIPFSLATAEYIDRLTMAVAPDGIVSVNVIGSKSGACGKLVASIHAMYASRFPFSRTYPLKDPSLTERQNIILAYSQSNHALGPPAASPITMNDAKVLTDNFAPVEFLQSQC